MNIETLTKGNQLQDAIRNTERNLRDVEINEVSVALSNWRLGSLRKTSKEEAFLYDGIKQSLIDYFTNELQRLNDEFHML